jgi:ATP-dependent Lhr-like helicase
MTEGTAVRGRIEKNLVIDTLLPANPGRFSWGGHLGKQMQLPVVDEIERSATTLVFVNMRSQAEAWYQFILDARPTGPASSRSTTARSTRQVRDWVELGLKEGRLKAVVATSSLDLGVDFLPVERVLQIGSAKGVARLLAACRPQRPRARPRQPHHAGADQHARAGRGGRGAARALAGRIEKRATHDKPFDVLSSTW